MTAPARALLLDLDGTLVSSHSLLRRVYREFLEAHGSAPVPGEFERLDGVPLLNAVATLREDHRLEPPTEELYRDYGERIDTGYTSLPIQAGGRRLLEVGRDAGWRIAIVTSAARTRALAWLREAGLSTLVQAVVAGDDVEYGKPNPAPYLLGLERLGCTAEGSVAVEDSPLGARAAVAAGLRTYVVGDRPRSCFPQAAIPAGDLGDVLKALEAV